MLSKAYGEEPEHLFSRHYSRYQPYKQGKGAEQRVTVVGGTELIGSRSALLVSRLVEMGFVSRQGAHLDFGCGGGTLLKTLSELSPDLMLSGADIGSHFADQVMAIPGVQNFLTPTEALAPESQWNVVWMVHVLEHMEDPLAILRTIRASLEPTAGVLVVQIPAHEFNPFDLAVADHLFHFTRETISSTLALAGFEIVLAPTQLVEREITCVARPGKQAIGLNLGASKAVRHLERSLNFLDAQMSLARRVGASENAVGIFGSSIAATWVLQLIKGFGRESIRCRLIDDDENRWGEQLMGFPIGPRVSMPATWPVMVPLVPSVADRVARELAHHGHRVCFVDERNTSSFVGDWVTFGVESR